MIMARTERKGRSASATASCGSCEFTASLCSEQSKDSLCRAVSFAPRVRAKKTLGLKAYTVQEMETTWYDEEEMEAIRLGNHLTVVKRRNGEVMDEEHFCFRGLEHQSRNGDESSNKAAQRGALAAVRKEQELQRVRGISDPMRLAKVYKKVARPFELDARDRGRVDEQVARDLAPEQASISPEGTNLGELRVCASRASILLARRRQLARRQIGGA
jgi:hypothetical protein